MTESSRSVRGLLLRRVDYRDADLIVTLFTETLGQISALARGARSSRRRFGGALETFATVAVVLHPPRTSELFRLESADLETSRLALVGRTELLAVAGRALVWLRRALPPRVPEPRLFSITISFLDQLEQSSGASSALAQPSLAEFGLVLLEHLGWGLELLCCVRCGKRCPEHKSARLDPKSGGLVCHQCGIGPVCLTATLRHRMRAVLGGATMVLTATEADLVLELVESTLALHAGLKA